MLGDFLWLSKKHKELAKEVKAFAGIENGQTVGLLSANSEWVNRELSSRRGEAVWLSQK